MGQKQSNLRGRLGRVVERLADGVAVDPSNKLLEHTDAYERGKEELGGDHPDTARSFDIANLFKGAVQTVLERAGIDTHSADSAASIISRGASHQAAAERGAANKKKRALILR